MSLTIKEIFEMRKWATELSTPANTQKAQRFIWNQLNEGKTFKQAQTLYNAMFSSQGISIVTMKESGPSDFHINSDGRVIRIHSERL